MNGGYFKKRNYKLQRQIDWKEMQQKEQARTDYK
jgi:hypothetical protein